MTSSNCPFCGSNNIDETCGDKEQVSGRKFYFVFCNKCEACGPTDYDQEKALQLWNLRQDSEDL
jgi:Lar family restriction alleviation protein